MSQKTTTRQITLLHRLVYAIYRGFECFLKLLPMKLVCLFGAAMGQVTAWILPARRRTVTRNLRIAFGDSMSLEDIHHLCHQTFRHSGANMLASFRTSSFSASQLRQHVEVTGEENLDAARKNGNGVICQLAHMGNWELMAQAHLIVPALIPPASLYRPLDNPLIDALIKRRRSSEGAELFSRRDGFFKPIAHIKNGGCLGVLADQNAGAHGLAVPLFGKLCPMTNLPAILHRRTGACILPLSMSSTSLAKWKITIHPPINIPADKKTNTQYISELVALAYEDLMSESPADVLWMHGYWKTGRKSPLKIDGLKKKNQTKEERGSEKANTAFQPFKVIVYTGAATYEDRQIREQLQRLKNYRPDIHITTVGESAFDTIANQHLYAKASDTSPLLVHSIVQHDQSMPAPMDCAIDFTESGQGGELFHRANISHTFTFYGKHQSPRTRYHFSTLDTVTLADLLDSLGMDD